MSNKKLILSISLFLFIFSCSNPNQLNLLQTDKASLLKVNTTDSNKNNEVLNKLKDILEKNGKISDEDINITVYNSVVASVVGINTTSVEKGFFRQNVVKGSGSGFIISKKGHILTNYHVVNNTTKLQVVLSNKKAYSAKVIGGNEITDVAVIKIEASESELNSANLGDSSNISVGQKVLAIGSPYGLLGTLTTGIISSINRKLPTEDGTELEGIIQTDAAINPGNSGGPLINSKGEIIGINTAIFSPNGGSVGIGFAIPINKVKDFLKTISL
ncbi:MAG: trypsin-like peptidase domain-containing protein [Candidatus Sericytochromatia bacterium]